MTTVNIEIHDQAVRQALGALAQRLGNLEPALLTIGEAMAERVKQRFNSQSGPGGQKWQALKPATVRAKKGNTAILFDKGHLRRQIVATATGNTLTLASVGLAYAAIQQFGGTIERAAGQTTVSHRTDAKGKLLRSAIMGGRACCISTAGARTRGLSFARFRRCRVITCCAFRTTGWAWLGASPASAN